MLKPVARLLVMPAAAAGTLLLGACSCDHTDPWNAAYIVTADAEIVPPTCEVETASIAESSGARVDPNLVEIARLEVERDCYRSAEARLRQNLQPGASLK
jgi:hypothetical protein